MNAENHGSRNLIILGIGAMILTIATTCTSLWIYRSSGDIYLDRSRPGFLPDKDEAKDEKPVESNYTFSETGTLDREELTEYLNQLKVINDRIKSLENPYSAAPLSDESLGITPMPVKPEADELDENK